MLFRRKQKDNYENQEFYGAVQISKDGFETSTFADLVLFPKSRACLLMNLVDMIGDEFVEESKKKNLLLDFGTDFSGISIIQNRDGFEGDDVIVLGEWEIYIGGRNHIFESIVEDIRTGDEELALKKNTQPPVIPVYSTESEVVTHKVQVRKNVSGHVVERVRKRGISIFGDLMFRLATLQSAFGSVFRKIGIVCAVGAALYSLFSITGIADNVDGGVIRVLIGICAVLAVGSMIFSGGILGVLKVILFASDLTSDSREGAVWSGEMAYVSSLNHDSAGAYMGIVSLAIQLAFILGAFALCLMVVIRVPIIPVLIAQGDRWGEEIDEKMNRQEKRDAAKRRKQALEEMQKNN